MQFVNCSVVNRKLHLQLSTVTGCYGCYLLLSPSLSLSLYHWDSFLAFVCNGYEYNYKYM